MRLYDSNRTVYAMPSENGEVGYTTVTEWPMQYAQVQTGVQTTYTDYASSRVVASVDTNVPPPYPMRPTDGWWRKGNIDGTVYQTTMKITTHGTNTTLNRAYELQLYSHNVTNSVWVPVTNHTGITVGGKPLTTNGTCVLLLRENLRTNLTLTVPAAMTNLVFVAGLTELAIDIQQVISDQIAGNECNSLPAAFFDDGNPMLMGTRSGNDARLLGRATFGSQFDNRAYIAVRKVGTTTLLGTVRATSNPAPIPVQFTAEFGTKMYEVVAGYDANQNNALEAAEVIAIFRKTPATKRNGKAATEGLEQLDKILVVTQDQYDISRAGLLLGSITPGYTGNLLGAFLNGSSTVSGAVTTVGVPLSSADSRLTHRVGAIWDQNCEAAAHRFTFTDGSAASDDFEASVGLLNAVEDAIINNIATLLATGQQTVTTSQPFAMSNEQDLAATDGIKLGKAFGFVPIIGSVVIQYSKVAPDRIVVTAFQATGSFDDLYDFSYQPRKTALVLAGGFSRPASVVQAGFATLSPLGTPGGRVFFTRLEFNSPWRPLNKGFSQ